MREFLDGRGSMLKAGNSYGEVYRDFRWDIPEYFNMSVDICDESSAARDLHRVSVNITSLLQASIDGYGLRFIDCFLQRLRFIRGIV